jgi:aminoglycoside N3'-acetyltransferase
MMTLGMGADGGGTTYFHYIESAFGVPYKYVKVLPCGVIDQGRDLGGTWTMSVRYHDFMIKNTPVRLKKRLLAEGRATEVQTGAARTWTARCAAAFETAIEALQEDRYFLLEAPPSFREGEIPMDGPSGAMQLRYDKTAGFNRVKL